MLRRVLLLMSFALATVTISFAQITSNGSFGDWNSAGTWTLGAVPTSGDDVIITAGDIVTVDASAAARDLTVQAGALLFANTSSPRLLDVHGTTISVDGTLGNGSTTDGIIFRLFNTAGTVTVSGSGEFDALRMLFFGTGGNGTLNINMDVNLRGSGPAFYNVPGDNDRDFTVTLASGSTLNLPNGNWSMDGAAGNGGRNEGGTFTVNGTLDVGGTLYLESNNTAGSGNSVQLSIGAAGSVKASQASTSSSGTNRFTLTMASGATLEFTSGSFGDLTASTVFTINANATVLLSGGALTFSYPDGDDGATTDTDVDNILRLAGTGTKTFDGSLTINGKLMLCGTASVAVTGALVYNSTLEYNGGSAQTTGAEWPATNGPTDIIINNANGVTMAFDRTLSGGVTLTDGDLDTDAFTLTLGPTASISSETNADRIIGSVATTRTVSGTESFGSMGFEMSGVVIEPNADVTVTRVTGPGGITDIGGNESIARKFNVSYGGSNFDKNLTISWFPVEDNGKTLGSMEMWKYNGTIWDKISPTPVDASSSRSVTETITSFSTFTITDTFNPLPVELVSFDAVADFKDVILRWKTASETNNAGFEVQMAVDDTFEALGYVEGNGTTLDPQQYQYRLTDLEAGNHVFRLKQIDFDGAFEYSPEVEIITQLPEVYALSPAYPNPFNPQTKFTLSVAREQQVRVEVYNLLGRRVALLFDGRLRAHQAHPFTFDASALPSGLYFYRATGQTFTATRKILLQK